MTSFCLPAKLKPAVKRKINALSAIETKVKAGMVSAWKGDHEFARLLYKGIGPA